MPRLSRRWDNSYFVNLLSHTWVKHKGPGGHWQWRTNGTSPTAPGPSGGRQNIMMMTSDVSLLTDPSYREIVEQFAKQPGRFDHAWKHAWYKLTTRDMGPVTRCVGDRVPPAEPWQHPLPPLPAHPANTSLVADAIRSLLHDRRPTHPQLGGELVRLAWQCASTWRASDYQGGCNGARIRFAPESGWPANAGLDKVLVTLDGIKERFGSGLSWADLIVIGGTTAIEVAGGPRIALCVGRSDSSNGDGSQHLNAQLSGDVAQTIEAVRLITAIDS